MPGPGGYTPVRPNERNRILENVTLSVITLVMPVSNLLKAATVTAPLPQSSGVFEIKGKEQVFRLT